MEKNVGRTDRIVRVIIGLIFLMFGSIYYFRTANPSVLLTVVLILAGVISLGTGIVGYCTLYAVMGTDTCSAE